jgi:DNA (cytosine-5)-methyltransferase 1
VHERYHSLEQFLRFETRLLSERAASGFLERTSRSSLRFPEGFLAAVEAHLSEMRRSAEAA